MVEEVSANLVVSRVTSYHQHFYSLFYVVFYVLLRPQRTSTFNWVKWLFMVFMKNPIQISKISGDITVIILWLSDNQKIEEVLKLVELHKSVGQNERVCQ